MARRYHNKRGGERPIRYGYHARPEPDTDDGYSYRSGGLSAHHCRLYEYYDQELSVPTTAGKSASNQPNFAIEVIVRKAGLQIANGVVRGGYDPEKRR